MSRYSGGGRPLAEAVRAELRAFGTEIDRLDQSAAGRFGLNRTDLRGLELLSAAGSLTPTALARALDFTTGGVTTVIDRLERAGYAHRRADPADRRRVIVEATELLRTREAEIFGDLVESIGKLVESYSDAELAVIHNFLARSRATIGRQVGAIER